jgi:pheromone a factor receptor
MYSTPNELYTAFSFIGFLFCAIPLYWHLESTLGIYSRDLEYLILGTFNTAWNMGTCLYMIWTGLGCLIQCVNSIVWNKNTTNRAPVYCDISKSLHALTLGSTLIVRYPTATRFQVALNAAIPASSLCINRRLYKAATAKTARPTDADKRRAVIYDLLIGVGIPILQIISRECVLSPTIDSCLELNPEYIVSPNRYNIYEDFGPSPSVAVTPPTFVLFYAWPVVIGLVSLYYCGGYLGLHFSSFVLWLMSFSHDYLRVIQAPTSVYAANDVFSRS